MSHSLSPDDRVFQQRFETCVMSPDEFDHRAHVRLAYVYLAGRQADEALVRLRSSLRQFLLHHGVPASKYHETMTRAWVLAVAHFMNRSAPAESADRFIDANPELLDSTIMLTHYSAGLLFSDEARKRFVEPDLDPIPRYENPHQERERQR